MKKLLIVDDDEVLRKLMELRLSDSYDILSTGEPEQALALALEYQPNAILLDLRMPKYSGYELCQTLTSFSRTQAIPIVVVSGEAGADTKEHCKQLGAAAYFEKPIDFEALQICLSKLAQERTYTPRNEVRVRLRVTLKLRGKDTQGDNFEEFAITENVSVQGFLCGCKRSVSVHSIVEVYLAIDQTTEYVGKAEIVYCNGEVIPVYRYGCRFVEKTGKWVLR
jgi:CheY-like chemotaxis protein